MIHLIETLWPGFVVALTLGAVLGFATLSPEAPSRASRIAALIVALIVLAALAAAVLEVVPGRAGLWLETALLLLAPYLAGCTLGALIGRALRGQGETPPAS